MKVTVDLDFEINEWGETVKSLLEENIKSAVKYEVQRLVKATVKEHSKGIVTSIKDALAKKPDPKMIQQAAEAALSAVWSKK